MAVYEWDDSIAIGIPVIDEQHKALFEWLETLDQAVKNGDGSEAVNDIIWKLISYVTEHFGAEERMMLTGNYPKMAGHRAEHDQFVKRLQEIQVSFIDGNEMSRNVLDFMADWLVSHIKGTDQEFSRFLRLG